MIARSLLRALERMMMGRPGTPWDRCRVDPGVSLAGAGHDEASLFQRNRNLARRLFCVVGTNGFAVRSAHEESPAGGWAIFVNAAVHVSAVHRDAPSIFMMRHHARTLSEMRGEISRDIVSRLQYHNQTAAHRIASRAMGGALHVASGRVRVSVASGAT
jgi:hypothetical protein